MHDHTILVTQLGARKAGKGYGVQVAKTWYWYENWLEKVIEKLMEGWKRPSAEPKVEGIAAGRSDVGPSVNDRIE